MEDGGMFMIESPDEVSGAAPQNTFDDQENEAMQGNGEVKTTAPIFQIDGDDEEEEEEDEEDDDEPDSQAQDDDRVEDQVQA